MTVPTSDDDARPSEAAIPPSYKAKSGSRLRKLLLGCLGVVGDGLISGHVGLLAGGGRVAMRRPDDLDEELRALIRREADRRG